MAALVRPSPPRESRSAALPRSRRDDSSWLVQFAIIALAVGIVAIILIAIFFRA